MASIDEDAEVKMPRYSGRGTAQDPYIVVWDMHDADNPYEWRTIRKAIITAVVSATPFVLPYRNAQHLFYSWPSAPGQSPSHQVHIPAV